MQKYTLFWGSKSPFSILYKCRFVEDGIVYTCVEQYIAYQKAVLFGDMKTAKQVLKERNPYKYRKLGRRVSNYRSDIWREHRNEIAYRGNLLKFSQNKYLKSILLATSGTILLEASPYLRIWMDEDVVASNWLGEILCRIREELGTRG